MNAEFPLYDKSFDTLQARGFIDMDSGAWDFDTNRRRARCGRCHRQIEKGKGQPYNQFMADGYRATTKYLCGGCVAYINRILAESQSSLSETEK